MKKHLLFLLPSLLLIPACATGSGSGIANESEMASSEAAAKVEAVTENIDENVSGKCVSLETTTESGDFNMTLLGVTVTGNASQKTTGQFDTIDNEMAVHSSSETSMSYAVQGTAASSTISSDTYVYYTDGTAAMKTVYASDGSEPSITRSVESEETNVSDLYAEIVLTYLSYLEQYEWDSVTYYGNSNDYDLRIAAKGEGDFHYDITFVDGLPQSFEMTQLFSESATGMSFSYTGTIKGTFSYSDSMDITFPDFTVEEW